jgi:small subunit ribosomal protein S17
MVKAKTKAGAGVGERGKEEEKEHPPAEEEIKKPKRKAIAEEIDKVQIKRRIKPRARVRVVRKRVKRIEKPPRDIGIEVTPPMGACRDPLCPFHGTLPVRGQIIEGVVVSDRMDKSVVVKKEHFRYVPKYERHEKRTRNYIAHNPLCIGARVGDSVKLMECRPLSKTKSFVVVELTTPSISPSSTTKGG